MIVAVEGLVWGNAALLQQNRRRLMGELREKIRRYEARYEIASSRVEVELKSGRLRETAEICDWLIAFRTYLALEHEQQARPE